MADHLKDRIDNEANNERVSVSRYLARIIEDYLNTESDTAIKDRMDQVDQNFEQLSQEVAELKNELLLLKNALQQALAQLSQLSQSELKA